MRKHHTPAFALPFRIVPMCYALVGMLLVVYIGLIAVVMSYAALTVEFTQSVRNDGAKVAELEKQYLAEVANITSVEYASEGYAKPHVKLFVRAKSGTALK